MLDFLKNINIYEILDFKLRLLLILIFLIVFAFVDFAINRKNANRWKEYLFLIASASIGSVFGVIIDQITVSISSQYFAIGKGLGFSENIRFAVVPLGAQAGLNAGVVLACLNIWLNNPKSTAKQLNYQTLSKAYLWPIGSIFLISPVTALLCYFFNPLGSRFNNFDTIDLQNINIVWGSHIGVYLGIVFGGILGARWIKKMRKTI